MLISLATQLASAWLFVAAEQRMLGGRGMCDPVLGISFIYTGEPVYLLRIFGNQSQGSGRIPLNTVLVLRRKLDNNLIWQIYVCLNKSAERTFEPHSTPQLLFFTLCLLLFYHFNILLPFLSFVQTRTTTALMKLNDSHNTTIIQWSGKLINVSSLPPLMTCENKAIKRRRLFTLAKATGW